MTSDDIAYIVATATGFLWLLVAIYAIWLFQQPVSTALGRLAGFEGFGIKLASGGAALDAAIELAQKNPEWPLEVPAADRTAALDRANAKTDLFFERAEIPWVDDRPSNNRDEAHMLRSFGALITFAATTEEAWDALQTGAEQHQPSTSSYPILDAMCRCLTRQLVSQSCRARVKRAFCSRSSIMSVIPTQARVCRRAPSE